MVYCLMIERQQLFDQIQGALAHNRVVGLLGPRQCGKTTLARRIVAPGSLNYFDLEDPRHLQRLEHPMNALEALRGVVVIDEVQRRPELFSALRVLADRLPLPAKFLVLGSSAPELLRQTSESLAGRIARVTMGGFSLSDVSSRNWTAHWLRGGYPLSFLAQDDGLSGQWRRDFAQTFLERDVPQFGFSIAAAALGRFWTMAAHYHGSVCNGAEFARSMGIGQSAVRRYLDLLTDLFMIRQLPAWHANLKKRQVKAPKIFFRDSGLLHHFLGIRSEAELMSHPKCGASWEGYVIEETLQAVKPDEAYFWATHQGAELDLLMIKDGRALGLECKRVDAPKLTASMRIALEDLKLERLAVVYPGPLRYPLAAKVEAVPLTAVAQGLAGLFP